MKVSVLLRKASDEEALFKAFVSPRWRGRGTLRELRETFQRPSRPIPYIFLPGFLNPEIAETWYEELQSAPRKVMHDDFGLHRWSPAWEQHVQGKWEGRWELLERRGFVLGRLIETLFLSSYFSRYLSALAGFARPLRYTGGHHKRMGPGDWENPHTDSQHHLTVVYYATKGWRREAGGSLYLGDWTRPRVRVTPGFNKLLVMKVKREFLHGIGKIRTPLQNPGRYSSVFWFRTTTNISLAKRFSPLIR